MIALRAWTPDDLGILERTVGDPAMMRHLGGAESPQAIADRHRRYLLTRGSRNGVMYAILRCDDRTAMGSIGFWERNWNATTVYETGWMVLPEFVGRGIATRAARLIVAVARRRRRHRFLHAFPSIENAASNRVCERAGFTNMGERDFEYPKGSLMRCNDWRLDLFA